VLLPDKEGKVGIVIVQGQKGKTVLNTAYASARTTSEGGVQRGTASQNEVKDVFWQCARGPAAAPDFLYPLFRERQRRIYRPIETGSKAVACRDGAQTGAGHYRDWPHRSGGPGSIQRCAFSSARRTGEIDPGGNGHPRRADPDRWSWPPRAFDPAADGVSEPRNRRVESACARPVPAQYQEREVVGGFGIADESRDVGTDRIDERPRIFAVPPPLEGLAQPTRPVELSRRVHCLGHPVGHNTHDPMSAHPMLGGDVGKSVKHA